MKIIITERDHPNPLKSHGSMILKQYTRLNDDSVIERAKKLGDVYGRVYIADVVQIEEFNGGKPDQKPVVLVPRDLLDEIQDRLGDDLLEKLPFNIVDDIPF